MREEQPGRGIVHLRSIGPAPRYRLWTLGTFRLEMRSGGKSWKPLADPVPEQQPARELLQCLISCPARRLSFKQVGKLLWPDLESSATATRLDQALQGLHELVEPAQGWEDRVPPLRNDRQMLRIGDLACLWIDADAFDALLNQARTAPDPDRKELIMEEAILLYRGDYLPGEHQSNWVQLRREALRRSWIGLHLELADLRMARTALPGAIDLLNRLLAIDPTNEAAVQRLLRLLAQLGRGTEARAKYELFRSALSSEYHLLPLLETRALYASCVLES